MPTPSDQTLRSCPACGTPAAEAFFSVASAPLFCNVLATTRDAALAAPRGPIDLACCPTCELVYNATFDPGRLEYAAGYENALDFSPHFREYQSTLVDDLVRRRDLHGARIVEIGCGQGDFLSQLCAAGGNTGFGFDPSFDASRAGPLDEGVTIRTEHFQRGQVEGDVDLICCRHVLEHIEEPLAFLREIRAAIGDRRETVVFFEVPDGAWTIERLGIWDIIYEHCSYFVPASLARLFAAAGFDVERVASVYGGQFLTIEARPASGAQGRRPETGEPIAPRVARFAEAYATMTATWRRRLAGHAAAGERVALWGAGSKGVTFLNVMGVDTDDVPCIVDLNPRKHGRFVPGTGQVVVPPAGLAEFDPALVIVMNPVYAGEIGGMLCDELGLQVSLAVAAASEATDRPVSSQDGNAADASCVR